MSEKRTLLYERAMSFIDAHLGDPDLSPERIADALHISRGHLHAVARGERPTIGRTILSKRLDRCCQLLADPRLANRTITEIAFACGFSDSAHFSRASKSQFGSSPRAYRNQVRRKPSTEPQ